MKKKDLTLNIHIISRRTHIYYTGELRKLGITMGQFPFIMGICNDEGTSQEKLSASLRISKSTTASVIGQLIENGLVQRTADPADRRKFCLALTEKGRTMIPQIKQVIRRCHALLSAGFSDGEKKILRELLRRVRDNSEQGL